jgi:HD-like signal output (HDOD) protein
MQTVSRTDRIRNLPAFPKVSLDLYKKLQSPHSTLMEVSNLLATDPALTARVLKLANSGYYSIPGGCSDVRKAFEYLGLTTIGQIVITSSIRGVFHPDASRSSFHQDFWQSSLSIAVAAECIARDEDVLDAAEAFTQGMLSDLGKLVWLSIDAPGFDHILNIAETRLISFHDACLELHLPTPESLKTELLSGWHLPTAMLTPTAGASKILDRARGFVKAFRPKIAGDFDLPGEEFSEKPRWLESYLTQIEKARSYING